MFGRRSDKNSIWHPKQILGCDFKAFIIIFGQIDCMCIQYAEAFERILVLEKLFKGHPN